MRRGDREVTSTTNRLNFKHYITICCRDAAHCHYPKNNNFELHLVRWGTQSFGILFPIYGQVYLLSLSQCRSLFRAKRATEMVDGGALCKTVQLRAKCYATADQFHVITKIHFGSMLFFPQNKIIHVEVYN